MLITLKLPTLDHGNVQMSIWSICTRPALTRYNLTKFLLNNVELSKPCFCVSSKICESVSFTEESYETTEMINYTLLWVNHNIVPSFTIIEKTYCTYPMHFLYNILQLHRPMFALSSC